MIHDWKERLNQRVLAGARLKVGLEDGTGCRSYEGSSSLPGGSPTVPKPPAPFLEAALAGIEISLHGALVLGGLFLSEGGLHGNNLMWESALCTEGVKVCSLLPG